MNHKKALAGLLLLITPVLSTNFAYALPPGENPGGTRGIFMFGSNERTLTGWSLEHYQNVYTCFAQMRVYQSHQQGSDSFFIDTDWGVTFSLYWRGVAFPDSDFEIGHGWNTYGYYCRTPMHVGTRWMPKHYCAWEIPQLAAEITNIYIDWRPNHREHPYTATEHYADYVNFPW